MSSLLGEHTPLRIGAPNFQRSISLTYDAGNADYIASYIPTPNGVRAMTQVVENSGMGKAQRAHVLHAAYGSGKSLLGLVLSAFVNPDDATQPALKLVLERVQWAALTEAERLQAFQDSQRRLLPVLMSGNEGTLSIALTRALTQTLARYGLGDLRPRTQFQAALTTIDLWERTYPVVYRQLDERLLEEGTSLSKLLSGLEMLQGEALDLFERLYPDLTAGAQFDAFTGPKLADTLHATAAALRECGYDGLIIIWDEFGRFIEAKAGEAFGPEAALLQDLAEFCNRSGEQQVHLVLITHRLLAGYAAHLPQLYQQEWARIAERFWSHDVSSDPLVTYRLIGEALTTPDQTAWHAFAEQHRSYFDDLTARSLELDLFHEVDDITLRQQIVERVWPLHPLTVYALPRLSNKVAQNERTLFTFLAAEEANALLTYLQLSHFGWWTVGLEAIWDYFAEAIRSDIGPGGSHAIWSGVMYASSKGAPEDTAARALVKALGVLLIVGEVNVQLQANAGRIAPTNELLAWGLGLAERDIAERLERLAQARAVIYREADGYWSFTRGSDVDLEAEITARIERKNPTLLQLRRFLEQDAPLPFQLPRGYNLERRMTRFFWGMYRWADEIIKIPTETLLKQLGSGYADGAVIYVLVKDQSERSKVLASLANTPQGRIVYVIPERPLLIMEPLHELVALRDLSSDGQFIGQDKDRLPREVAFFIEDAQRRLSRALHPLLDPNSGDSSWYWPDGHTWRQERIQTEAEASRLLSRLCGHWFNETPILNNELLNQQEPSAQQIRAAERVIEALFAHQDAIFSPDLGIVGFGPDYLAFRTILVVPGLLQPIQSEAYPDQIAWQLGRPTDNEALAHIWDIVQAFLDKAVEEEREAVELLDKLQSPPYGLRRGVLPVLLAAMLRSRLHVLTVRQNRRAISPVTGQTLTELCQKPEQFTLEVGPWDERRANLWEVLQTQFHSFVGLQERIHQPLSYLSLALLRWLQAQPRFCRDTNQLSTEARRLRDLIRKAQRDPAKVLLYELLDLLDGGDLDISDQVAYQHVLANRLNQLLNEITTAYQSLLYQLDRFAEAEFATNTLGPASGHKALHKWLNELEQQTDEPLATFRFSDELVQRFVEAVQQEQDEGRFWDHLSYAVMGLYPHDWNDRSIDTFKQNLLEARDRLQRELFALTEDEAVIELSVNLPGSEERTYRFRPSDLSTHGQRLLQNFISTLEIAGRPLSPDERRQVALALFHYVMEGSKPDDSRPGRKRRHI